MAKSDKKGNGVKGIKGYHKNPRTITKHQHTLLEESLKKYGDISGIVHDLNTNEIISGNQRNSIIDIEKCEVVIQEQYETPTETGTVAMGYVIWNGEKYNYRQVRWTTEQCEAANIAANKVGGEFDFEILANDFEIETLFKNGFEEKDFFGRAAKEKAGDKVGTSPLGENGDNYNEKTIDTFVTDIEEGDLIEAHCSDGRVHRILCGDASDFALMEKLMGGKEAVFAYVQYPEMQNDTKEDKMALTTLVSTALFQYSTKYATMIVAGWKQSEFWQFLLDDLFGGFAFKNEIIHAGIETDGTIKAADSKKTAPMQLHKAGERMFFLAKDILEKKDLVYWQGWEPIREYLADEAKKMNWKATQVHEICHVKGMFKYWFSKDNFELIPQHHYEMLQKHAEGQAFNKTWEKLKEQYDSLLSEYNAEFPHFEITEKDTDVWLFPSENRENSKMLFIEKAIKIMSKNDDIIAIPFLYRGAALSAGHRLGRKVYAIDKDPLNIAIAIDRLLTIDRGVQLFKNGKKYSLEIETF